MDIITQYLPFILDGLIILIFICHTAVGIKRGLVGTLAAFAITIVGFVLIHQYADEIATIIIDKMVHQHLYDFIADRLTDTLNNGSKSVLDSLPLLITEAAENAGVSLSRISASAIDGISEKTATGAESIFIKPALIGILYILTYTVANVINHALTEPIGKLVNHVPIVGKVNKLLGGLFGAAKGLAAVFILVVLVFVINHALPDTLLDTATEKTVLLNEIMETAEQFIR